MARVEKYTEHIEIDLKSSSYNGGECELSIKGNGDTYKEAVDESISQIKFLIKELKKIKNELK